MLAMFGFLLGQSFLLGMWAALGGLPTVPRWLIVGAVYSAAAIVVTSGMIGWVQMPLAAPVVLPAGGALFTGIAAVLLPLRRLAGWRIDFDEAYHPRPAKRRGQLVLMDFAAMFCAVALPLTLCRALMEGDQALGLSILLTLIMFGLVVLVTAAPVARAVLAQRRRVLWLGGAALWVLAVVFCQSLLAAQIPDLNLGSTSASFLGVQYELLALHGGIAAAVGLPLLALRLCGLKLLVIG
jgi:hypothetical protein